MKDDDEGGNEGCECGDEGGEWFKLLEGFWGWRDRQKDRHLWM